MTETAQIAERAQALIEAGELEQAEALIAPHLAGGTGPMVLWAVLAKCLRHQGRPREALAVQQLLVDAVPGNVSARFDLAETLLMLGEFERGWREYHYRYSLEHTTRIARKVQRPRWNGRPIPGKTLLIHDEQGFGDTLQFIRMVAWAKARSQATVILEVSPDLRGLAERCAGHDVLITRGTIPPPFDAHCEMMSLPMVMGFSLADLPGTMPYLSPDPARLARWRRRLDGLARPLVALNWAGRPVRYHGQDRAVTLAALAPLARDGVTFLSVQKGPPAAQAASPPPGMALVDLSAEIGDFEDTAAILSLADLLISIDSAPAHLAGALARPAWILLGHVADWRWLLERADSPWYPSLRLFRQPRRGDWDSVIATVAGELRALR